MELLHLAPETLNFHCPFNASHTMPQKTLTKHITKCPDKPPHFKHCIYNLAHAMPESELKDHEENCPNRILIDVAVYQSEDMIRPNPNVENLPSIKYEESWDGLEQTSEIMRTIKTKTASMKATHGMTKSERKQHRINLHENDIYNVNNKGLNDEKKQNKNLETKPLFIGKRPNT
ncbi:gametocyte-specific factor 1 homolog [Rhopalosiphum maidis]|uniref:gametocyte-specific factor 1 homolog n=1 Tax=Rhopalosiphum maidis TaxID=43146 RepID=UPI000EFF435A|nr:gametocyte-specific factor 1 homolog [Rhopalosiphum maidis]